MSVLIGVGAALVSAAMCAFKDVFFKSAIKKAGVFNSLFYSYAFGLIPITAFFLLTGGFCFSTRDLQLGLALGTGSVAGFALYFKALESGRVSLAGPVSGIWAVFTVIAAFVFLGEQLNLVQIAGIPVAFAGIFLIATKRIEGEWNSASIAYAVAAAVVWGFTWFLIKPLTDSVGVIPAFVLYAGVGTAWLLVYGISTKKFKLPDPALVLPSALQTGAYLIETWGIMLSTVSLVSLVFSPAYVLFLIPASRFLLGERLEKRHYAGITMILLGVLLISIG